MGKVLCEALKSFPSLPEDNDDKNSQRKRPRLTKILDEEVHVGISATSMQEAMHVHRNLARFPILAFSNEPVSHLANKDVRHIESVVVNDGDGVTLGVNPSSDTPLHNATYTRLN